MFIWKPLGIRALPALAIICLLFGIATAVVAVVIGRGA